MTAIAATGHRPHKLAAKNICYSTQVQKRLTDLAISYLLRNTCTRAITGMALGWDTAFCIAASELGIPVTAAIPFKGQELRWNEQDQIRYRQLLERCDRVVCVSEGSFSHKAMQKRNEWMVDNSDKVVALWNGDPGGTKNCLVYCESKEKPFENVWSSWVKYAGVDLGATN